MESLPLGSPTSLRSIPPGTLAAACSGDIFRRNDPTSRATQSDETLTRRQRSRLRRRSGRTSRRRDERVGFAVFEIDPPISLDLDDAQKAQLALERARLVRCNATMAALSGYGSVDEVEGVSLAELMGAGRSSCEHYFESFFARDLVHEGLTEEEDRAGNLRVFSNRTVGVERAGLLYEVIATKCSCDDVGSSEDQGGVTSTDTSSLTLLIRKLDRAAVAAILQRAHEELIQRRHALLEYQLHGLSGSVFPRLLHRSVSRPQPDPQDVFARVQANVLCVLERAIREQSERSPRSRRVGHAAATAQAPSPHIGVHSKLETRELSVVLNALDRILPGSAERMLAEVLLHWKAKEACLRREPPRMYLLASLGRRAIRCAARALLGDRTFGCLLQVVRWAHFSYA